MPGFKNVIMKQKYLGIIILVFNIFSALTLDAQTRIANSKVKGRVLDERSKPLYFATISLLNATDSTLIRTAVSGLDGSFLFENLLPGNYRVSVSMVGFLKTSSKDFALSDISVVKELGDIKAPK